MSDETSKKVYWEKLKDVREAVKAAKRLMKSEEGHIRIQAIDLFLQLSELEIALVAALRAKPETQAREERNPLARRAKLDR